MSRVFSISLNDLTFAKLGELQKKYPDMSRNAMINHIINVVHSGEFDTMEIKDIMLKQYEVYVALYQKKYGVLPNPKEGDKWMKEKNKNILNY